MGKSCQQPKTKRQRRSRTGSRSLTVTAAAPAAARQKPLPNDNVQSEEGVYDCVIVGGGISGLVTAQAFASDHPDTVKKYVLLLLKRNICIAALSMHNIQKQLGKEGLGKKENTEQSILR